MIVGILLALAVLLLAAFLYWQNNSIQVDEYAVESPALPPELEGCRIVQLSDLHNKSFGPDQKRLVEILDMLEPDLILITGDLIDKRRTKEDGWENALSLVRQAAEMAPVFYVSGNHEWESGLYRKLRPLLESSGAEILDDGFTILDHGDAAMSVMGLSDPAAFSRRAKAGNGMRKEELPACVRKMRERLLWLCEQQEEGHFQVLAAHRPQLLHQYAKAGVHLVFCGHAHGGQVRLPGIGGLYAPNQGLRPEFTEGPYIDGNTVMIVSRGLGNSSFPARVFNRPNVVAVTLHAPEEETPEEMTPDTEAAAVDFDAVEAPGREPPEEAAEPAEVAEAPEAAEPAEEETADDGVFAGLPETPDADAPEEPAETPEPEPAPSEAELAAAKFAEVPETVEALFAETEEAVEAVFTEPADEEAETAKPEETAETPEPAPSEAELAAAKFAEVPETVEALFAETEEAVEAVFTEPADEGAETAGAAETPEPAPEEPAAETDPDEEEFRRLQAGEFPAMDELPEEDPAQAAKA